MFLFFVHKMLPWRNLHCFRFWAGTPRGLLTARVWVLNGGSVRESFLTWGAEHVQETHSPHPDSRPPNESLWLAGATRVFMHRKKTAICCYNILLYNIWLFFYPLVVLVVSDDPLWRCFFCCSCTCWALHVGRLAHGATVKDSPTRGVSSPDRISWTWVLVPNR